MADSIGLKSQQVGPQFIPPRPKGPGLSPHPSSLPCLLFNLHWVSLLLETRLFFSCFLLLGHTLYSIQWTHNDSNEWKCANKYVSRRKSQGKKIGTYTGKLSTSMGRRELGNEWSLFIVRSQIQHLRNYCANLGTQVDLFFGFCERNATTTPKTCAWQCMQMTAFFPWPKKWGKSALHWGKIVDFI